MQEQAGRMRLSPHMAYNISKDPKRLAFVLARYSFAGQITENCSSVLELGCSEGVGASLLHKNRKPYLGLDLDAPAIEAAQRNFASEQVVFKQMNFLDISGEQYGAAVSLDVIEHIHKGEDEDRFLRTIAENITPDGVCVIGTPNITSTPYASAESQLGHVNMFDAPRLKSSLEEFFANVFIFSMNDELIHTGYHPMAHYLFAVGCNKISGGR